MIFQAISLTFGLIFSLWIDVIFYSLSWGSPHFNWNNWRAEIEQDWAGQPYWCSSLPSGAWIGITWQSRHGQPGCWGQVGVVQDIQLQFDFEIRFWKTNFGQKNNMNMRKFSQNHYYPQLFKSIMQELKFKVKNSETCMTIKCFSSSTIWTRGKITCLVLKFSFYGKIKRNSSILVQFSKKKLSYV